MTSPTLYRARYLLPITSPPIEDGALLVADGVVLASGSFRDLSRLHPDAEVVDFDDGIILPPFVNAHTHLELTDFSQWAEAAGEPEPPSVFVDWILWLVRIKRTVAETQLRTSLGNGLQKSLEAGTGMIGDILTTLDIISAYASAPLSGRIFCEVLGRDRSAVQSRLAEIGRVLARNDAQSFDVGLSPHSSYTLSQETLQDVFEFAGRAGLQSCIHLAESREESRFLRDASGPVAEKLYAAAKWPVSSAAASGLSPVQTLAREELLKPGDLIVHGVEVSKDDICLLKKKNCSVVLCPRSNAALGGGRAPVADYLAAGINLALGTDSLASSRSLSVWDELAFAQEWFKDAASPGQWLEIATLGGARALGVAKPRGFASGEEASFQVAHLPAAPDSADVEKQLCRLAGHVKVSHLYLCGRNVLPIA